MTSILNISTLKIQDPFTNSTRDYALATTTTIPTIVVMDFECR